MWKSGTEKGKIKQNWEFTAVVIKPLMKSRASSKER
jgi:hypothetical protein